MKYTRLLDNTFELSLILKGIDGVLELVGAVLLVALPPSTISSVARFVTEHELSRDSRDWVSRHIVSLAHHLASGTNWFGFAYLLSHGVVKLVLVVALLRHRLWAYPWMMGFIGIFTLYQVYRLGYSFSIGLFVLTLFDLFIIWLTWLEYRKAHGSGAAA